MNPKSGQWGKECTCPPAFCLAVPSLCAFPFSCQFYSITLSCSLMYSLWLVLIEGRHIM
jgi:hypothetical protein